MKTKSVKSKFVEMVCDDGHVADGVLFVGAGFVGELPVSGVRKAGGVKRVKELIVSFVAGGDVPADFRPWLEDGVWRVAA